MPKMEWKLKDPKKCDGCPFLYFYNEIGVACLLHGEKHPLIYDYVFKRTTRPKSCIDKFGE